MTQTIDSREKLSSLQGLRTFAFLMVFLLHVGISDTGEIGVSLFFVLSGFVLYYSYSNKNLPVSVKDCFKFSFSKIKKLYLLHIVTGIIMLTFVVKEVLFLANPVKTIKTVWYTVLNALLLQVWVPREEAYFSLNGVSWFLAVCMFLYILFPVVLKFTGRYKGIKSAGKAIIVTIMLMGLLALAASYPDMPENISENFPKWFTYIFPVYRFGDFFIGCNLCYIYKNIAKKPSVLMATLFEFSGFSLLLIAYLMRRFGILFAGNYALRYNLVYLPATMIIVFFVACSQGYISKFLSLKPIVFAGNLTGFAYLIHSVFIKIYFILFASASTKVNPWINAVIIFAVSLLLAYLWDLGVKKVTRR